MTPDKVVDASEPEPQIRSHVTTLFRRTQHTSARLLREGLDDP